VPMGRDLEVMPWLGRRGAGVVEAVERARTLHRRTALLVDNTADKVVDTFYQYRHVVVLEAKAMVVEERTGKRSRAQVLEQARCKLVRAMRYGHTLYVRMGNTACSFRANYSSATTLPLAIFDQAAVDELAREYSGPEGRNLFGAAHPLAAALREADTDHGHFTCRRGFEVVVSTHLPKADVPSLLGHALPMSLLQPIVPCVKPRPAASATAPRGPFAPSADRLGTSPTDGRPSIDPAEDTWRRPWTLEDAHAGAVRLRERVEAARARRASTDSPPSLPPGTPACPSRARPQPLRPLDAAETPIASHEPSEADETDGTDERPSRASVPRAAPEGPLDMASLYLERRPAQPVPQPADRQREEEGRPAGAPDSVPPTASDAMSTSPPAQPLASGTTARQVLVNLVATAQEPVGSALVHRTPRQADQDADVIR
jgi:hypothetical protein